MATTKLLGSMKPTDAQTKDTGLAMTLILMLVIYFSEKYVLVLPAIAVLVLTMTLPAVFKPLAFLWFGVSNILGMVVSRILLTAVFFVVATPVGLMMRMTGKDSMQVKAWKNGADSVFSKRDHTFTANDLEQPY